MSAIMQGRAAQSPWQIILIAGLLLCFEIVFPVAAYAQSPRLEKIRIVERGAYSADADRRVDERSSTGAVNAFKNTKLIKSTVAIPGRIGTNFGVQYRPQGEPKGASVDLKVVIIFPSQGLHNPSTRATVQQTDFVSHSAIGLVSYSGYQFDHDWEIEPGKWTFEIWHGNRLLVEQHFCVYNPDSKTWPPGDDLYSVCEGKIS